MYGLLYHLAQFVINMAIICIIAKKVDTLDNEEDFYVKRFRAMRWVHLLWALSGTTVNVTIVQ